MWEAIRKILPREDTVYFADQAHMPYGTRSLEEVRCYCEGIVHFLLSKDVKVIVIACNAASAASLHWLRERFQDVPFVGMEPAVKPAVENTRTGIVGVIATETTFQGTLFSSLLEEHGDKAQVLTEVGHGWAKAVEEGEMDSPATMSLVQASLNPLIESGIDQLVLGCTHYPFLRNAIEEIVGPGVNIIDPAPAVAFQTERVLKRSGLINISHGEGRSIFYTSGRLSEFSALLERLVEKPKGKLNIQAVRWERGGLELG